MQIVTLITDLGQKDHYLGLLKGALLSQHTQLNIIDINNAIKDFNIAQAAFVLKNCYAEFPLGTIHLVNVMPYYESHSNPIAFEKNGHYFVGVDNGVFTLAFDEGVQNVRTLEGDKEMFFVRKIYAKMVSHVAQRLPMEELGMLYENPVRRIGIQPVISNGQLRANVIHIDHFGNAITSITAALFEQVCKNRKFALFFKNHEPILTIHKCYSDVPVGDLVCFFNSNQHLEIALNMNNLSKIYGVKINDGIILKWV